MRIIVGLGNPGVEYQQTHHNSGVMLVDKLAEKLTSNYGWRKHYNALIFKTDDLWLVKTRGVFMNESGRLIANCQWPIANLYVAHDDLDIKLGEYKVQKGKGPRDHNGVLSVEQALGTKEFWRIRIGIDNRSIPNAKSGEDYVLERFSPQEKVILEKVLDEITQAVIGG